ncbi:hypothetical protein [Mesorhizobium shangrilense]|uniref:Uncharacterized protein n=1 Tax=Mesorhizobium shangrilense TaxID=460060 RepID=A0ABV2DIS1_9HYPH
MNQEAFHSHYRDCPTAADKNLNDEVRWIVVVQHYSTGNSVGENDREAAVVPLALFVGRVNAVK